MAKTDPIPEVAPVARDEMHLDDFLNHMESLGRRELAAAFSVYAKFKGWAKKELAEWQTEFEKFAKMTPQDMDKELGRKV